MLSLHREAWNGFLGARRDLIPFSILFRLFEALVFTPLAALVGQAMSGRLVVDSTDLVAYFLSPRGFVASLLGGTLLLTIRLVEHAGLTVILLGAVNGRRVSPLTAFRVVRGLSPRLLGVAVRILLAGLATAAPLFVVAVLFARPLLAQHDINYYIAERPPELLLPLGTTVLFALATFATAIWLAVRWRLVIPVLVCEEGSSTDVLRSSAQLARGQWREVAAAWLATVLLILGLGFLAAWIGRSCSLLVAYLTQDSAASHWALFFGILALRTVLTGFVTMPGSCISAAVFATLYVDFRRARDPGWSPALACSPAEEALSHRERMVRRLLAFLPLLMVGLAVANTLVAMNELYADRPVSVTAHRGGTRHAMENTLPAIREAIEAGAQFAEIDVQMSRDGVLVVTHDSDFSRQAGIATKVWELTYDEIRAIPLSPAGSGGDPTYAPTFDEVLDEAKGKIKLNVELKYYGEHQPRLAERIIEALRARDMAGQVIVQSLHYAGLEEVRRLAAEIPIGYLFSVNARQPKRLDVDFLSVQASRASGSFIAAAHRRGQAVHVWTVDKPADMERLIDLGVDNLITNQPSQALKLARDDAALAPHDRALRRIRTWLRE